MNTQKNQTSRRRAMGAISALLIVALLLTGTYAWNYYGEHKTNEAGKQAETRMFDLRLIEDFLSTNDWRIEDPTLLKKVSVISMGSEDQGYSPAYVRLLLKEYMEITGEATPEYYTDDEGNPIRFLIGHDDDFGQAGYCGVGRYICFDDHDVAASCYDEPERRIVWLTDAVTGQTGWFVSSMQKDLNGQYGRYVLTGMTKGATQTIIPPCSPGDPRFYVNTNQSNEAWLEPQGHHQAQSNGECQYPVTSISDQLDGTAKSPTLPIRNYISIIFKSGALMSMSDFYGWNNGNPIDRWIYDETGDDPYIYWGQALKPGEETHDLTSALNLLQQPGAGFYYALHIDMESQHEPWWIQPQEPPEPPDPPEPTDKPKIKWQRSYGSDKDDNGMSLIAKGNEYIGVGSTGNGGRDVQNPIRGDDAWTIFADSYGVLSGEMSEGAFDDDIWNTIRDTNDGGYIKVGRYGDATTGGWIYKTGPVTWDHRLHQNVKTGIPSETVWSYASVDVAEAKEDGYFILSNSLGKASTWVTKLDRGGKNVLWDAKILHGNNVTGRVDIGALCLSPECNPVYINRFNGTIVMCDDNAMGNSPPPMPNPNLPDDAEDTTAPHQIKVWSLNDVAAAVNAADPGRIVKFDKILALGNHEYLIAGAGVVAKIDLTGNAGDPVTQAKLIDYMIFDAYKVPSRIVRQNGENLLVGASGVEGWLAKVIDTTGGLSFAWEVAFGKPSSGTGRYSTANDVVANDDGYTTIGSTTATSPGHNPHDPDLTASGGPGIPKISIDRDFWMARLEK